MALTRTDQYNVTVVLAGQDLGTFDTLSGGLIDSEEQKYRPGNMGKPVALGGAVTVENITVGRDLDLERDVTLIPLLKAQVGKGPTTVTKQTLDADGNAFGAPMVYKGKLKSFQPTTHDSNASDAATFELEISTDGDVG